jgi:Icc-related predicted phosphoesterase
MHALRNTATLNYLMNVFVRIMSSFATNVVSSRTGTSLSGVTATVEIPLGWDIVCISDTHGMMGPMMSRIPPGDILIHAGDFTNVGSLEDIQTFKTQFESLPHKHKIFIAGNHDNTLDSDYYNLDVVKRFQRELLRNNPTFDAKKYSEECIGVVKSMNKLDNNEVRYLEDEGCEIKQVKESSDTEEVNTVSIYGSPWQPEFCDWAFNLQRQGPELLARWRQIPANVDILITHGPPYNILDTVATGEKCGCEHLAVEVKKRIKPRIHIFGHIHETYGKRCELAFYYMLILFLCL